MNMGLMGGLRVFFGWIADPFVGRLVIRYTTHGCMGTEHELSWVGRVERPDPEHVPGHLHRRRYLVRVLGRRDEYFGEDCPAEWELVSDFQLIHWRDGHYAVFD